MAVGRGSIGVAWASVSGTTVTVTNPGYVTGTLLVAHVCWASTATITGTPSDWNILSGTPFTGNTNSKYAVYWKVATGSEPGTYVWTMSASNSFAGVVMRDYTAADPTTPLTGLVTTSTANSTTPAWPAIDRTGTGAIVCVGSQVSSRTPSTIPSFYTDQQATWPWRVYMFDRMDAPTGTNAGFTRTLDSGSGGSATGRYLIAAAIPANTVAPAVTGTPDVGQTLSCSTGTWTNSPDSYAYQWKADGGDISGATNNTYQLTALEAETTVKCTVTATNVGGTSSGVDSNEVEVGEAPVAQHGAALRLGSSAGVGLIGGMRVGT